jgi:hypothetical protein
MRDLHYKGDISDYLVTLNDLNRRVNASGQTFQDQVRSKIADNIIDMMFRLAQCQWTILNSCEFWKW